MTETITNSGPEGFEWREKAISGLAWSFFSQWVAQAFSFVIGVVLARILSPVEFGLVGMILVFSGLLKIFVEQGMGAAIIQKQDTPSIKGIFTAFYYLFPNLEKFNIRNEVVYGIFPDLKHILLILLYAACYGLFLFSLAKIIFERRQY